MAVYLNHCPKCHWEPQPGEKSKWCQECGYTPGFIKSSGYASERVTRDGRPVEAGRCTECERPHDDRKSIDEATARMCNDAAKVETRSEQIKEATLRRYIDQFQSGNPAYGTNPAEVFLDQVIAENTSKKVAAERKATPVFSGLLAYFPDACRAVARLSQIGNDQHNPGQPLHWAREKSNDHADCLVRHQLEVGTRDTDGVRHAAKVAWRALAQLQLEIEADNGQ